MCKIIKARIRIIRNLLQKTAGGFPTMHFLKIEAIVREEKMEDVKAALNEIQVNGFTVTQIMGCGTPPCL